jgi:hypothetical protein
MSRRLTERELSQLGTRALGITRSITLIHRRDQFRAHEDSVQKVLTFP